MKYPHSSCAKCVTSFFLLLIFVTCHGAHQTSAKIHQTTADLAQIALALEEFRALYGGYPTNLAPLRSRLGLLQLPRSDAWGNRYLVIPSGSTLSEGQADVLFSDIVLASCGEDGQCTWSEHEQHIGDDLVLRSGHWVTGVKGREARDISLMLLPEGGRATVAVENASPSEAAGILLEVSILGSGKIKSASTGGHFYAEGRVWRFVIHRLPAADALKSTLTLDETQMETVVLARIGFLGPDYVDPELRNNVAILRGTPSEENP